MPDDWVALDESQRTFLRSMIDQSMASMVSPGATRGGIAIVEAFLHKRSGLLGLQPSAAIVALEKGSRKPTRRDLENSHRTVQQQLSALLANNQPVMGVHVAPVPGSMKSELLRDLPALRFETTLEVGGTKVRSVAFLLFSKAGILGFTFNIHEKLIDSTRDQIEEILASIRLNPGMEPLEGSGPWSAPALGAMIGAAAGVLIGLAQAIRRRMR